MTAADSNERAIDRTVEEFRGFTSCLDGSTETGIVSGTGAWGIGDIKGTKAMKVAYEMGTRV